MNSEYWDVLDVGGRPTGCVVPRDKRFGPGCFHGVVHAWIRNRHGPYLVQRRSDHLERIPRLWATTTGSVLSGEDSATAAIRETREELGVELSRESFAHWARIISADRIEDTWLAELEWGVAANVQNNREVAVTAWMTGAESRDAAAMGHFFGYSYLGRLLEY